MKKKKKKAPVKNHPPTKQLQPQTLNNCLSCTPQKANALSSQPPYSSAPFQNSEGNNKKKKNAIRKIWSPPPHVRATSLCVPPPRTAISKPFLMESPSKDDKLHLHQHYFCICSPVAYPTQCNNRNLEATKMATNMKWKMKSIRLHCACILKADF